MQLECLYNENNLLKVKMNLRIRFANEQLTDLQLPPIDPRRTSVVQVKHMVSIPIIPSLL
jgi:hypothetical protein